MTQRIEEYSNGKYWYLNGKLHRVDGPAVENSNGSKHWCLNGKLHRVDGPAVENSNGSKHWYLNGSLHRIGGPAIDNPNAPKSWYVEGKLHRLDGPAIEHRGEKCWYINSKKFSEEKFYSTIRLVKRMIRNMKTKLRNKYISKLRESDICDEKFLYDIIAGYII